MKQQFWLVKQEPEAYSWTNFLADGKTAWTGIRNYQARNYLRQMNPGDPVLFYHSVSEKAVVGLAKVISHHYPDPTAETGEWSCMDLEPVQTFPHPVPLSMIKNDPVLKEIPLIRQSRLSLMPLSEEAFQRLLELGECKKRAPF